MLISLFGRSIWLIMLAIVLIVWRTSARVIRAQTLALKQRQFIAFARAQRERPACLSSHRAQHPACCCSTVVQHRVGVNHQRRRAFSVRRPKATWGVITGPLGVRLRDRRGGGCRSAIAIVLLVGALVFVSRAYGSSPAPVQDGSASRRREPARALSDEQGSGARRRRFDLALEKARCSVSSANPAAGSTLVKALLRLLPASTRSKSIADFNGRDLRTVPVRFDAGSLAQWRSSAARKTRSPGHRVGDQIVEAMRAHATTRAKANERVAELFDLVGLRPELTRRFPARILRRHAPAR